MKRYVLLLIFNCISIVSIAQIMGWNYLPNAPVATSSARFDDVYFINTDTGWAVNGTGLIYKTSDGGNEWNIQFSVNQYFRSVEFLNADTGFAGTLGHAFYRTTDGGITWKDISNNMPPQTFGICGMSHIGNIIYGVGVWSYPAYVIKSTDAGDTWSYTNMSTYAWALVDAWFINADTGFVSGQEATTANGIILKTTNGGTTWNKVYSSSGYNDYNWKLQFTKNGIGYASIESLAANISKIVKSVDGGNTWQEKVVTSIQNIDMEAVGFVNDTLGWCGGWSLGMWQTIDGGENWLHLNFGNNVNRIFRVNDTLVYAAGYSIYKFSLNGNSNATSNEPSSQHELLVNPNPVKEFSEVEVKINRETFLILEVFDVTGKIVTPLARGTFEKGTYVFTLKAVEYPAGNYIVGMRTNEHFLSKKIIVTGK